MENEIKPITKKELIKRIEEYKPKYIYQRYNGEIRQFEVIDNNYLVETKTGMSFDFRSHLMLGKVSENLIDLIKLKDIIKIHNLKGDDISFWFEIFDDKTMMDFKLGLDDNEIEILEVVTKEMIEPDREAKNGGAIRV